MCPRGSPEAKAHCMEPGCALAVPWRLARPTNTRVAEVPPHTTSFPSFLLLKLSWPPRRCRSTAHARDVGLRGEQAAAGVADAKLALNSLKLPRPHPRVWISKVSQKLRARCCLLLQFRGCKQHTVVRQRHRSGVLYNWWGLHCETPNAVCIACCADANASPTTSGAVPRTPCAGAWRPSHVSCGGMSPASHTCDARGVLVLQYACPEGWTLWTPGLQDRHH